MSNFKARELINYMASQRQSTASETSTINKSELQSEKSPKNNNDQFNALDNLEQKYIELETK